MFVKLRTICIQKAMPGKEESIQSVIKCRAKHEKRFAATNNNNNTAPLAHISVGHIQSTMVISIHPPLIAFFSFKRRRHTLLLPKLLSVQPPAHTI